MSNREKLRDLLLEVFLLDPSEFRWDLTKQEIDTWDSLGTVSMAVGVEETFGYHFKPVEALAIDSVQGIIDILQSKGIAFES